MKNDIRILNTYEYKLQFLPNVNVQALHNKSRLQLYRIEDYLKEIIIPVPPYRTSFNFLFFVTEGFVKQQIESENLLITSRQILNIKQGSITRTHELSQNIKGFYIIYENDVITSLGLSRQDIIFLTSDPIIKIHENTCDFMIKTLELLETELQAEHIHEDICITFFRAIMLKIIKNATYKPSAMARELKITYKFREQLQQEYKLHKNVLFYAQELNISETYLNKCLKKVTGKPPKQWINEICIQHSQILLCDLGREIAEVAYELNFQSLSHFSRVFKKVTSKSPSAFRLEVLNKSASH